MKVAKIILTIKKAKRSNFILFFLFHFLSAFIYANELEEINYPFSIGGKEYIMRTSDDYYNLFIIDKKTQKKIFIQENFLFDGMYILKNLRVRGNTIIIMMEFDGAGRQKRDVYYMKSNEKFILIKETFSDIDKDNHSRIKVCDIFVKNKKKECFYEVIRGGYLYIRPNNKSYLYLEKGDRVKLLQEKLDKKNNKWYLVSCESKNNIIMWIESGSIDYN